MLQKRIDQLKEEKNEHDQNKKTLSSQKQKDQQQLVKGGERQIKIDTLMKKKNIE